ncbi:MAG: hypothetical protein U1E15_05065 [Hyphomicrobiales bacterium]
MAETQTLWTSGGPLGPSLATAVLHGVFAQCFAGIPLARWTILVPTRRAARILEAELTRQSGQAALLLPRIRPIGDVDEDVLAAALPDVALPDVISPATLLFLLIDIVRHWSAANPQLTLAAEVAQSSTQAFGLAQSLQDFFEQLATEDIEPGWVPKLGKLDLAAHRNAIISLFGLVQEELPRRLQALGLVTPAQRRNTALHLEAQRMAAQHGMGPVIAAGSTGTNPAARALLKAIAAHPLGAVVLPGLDLAMDDATWEAVGDTHPQAALKTLLAALGVARPQVAELSPMGTRAQFLQAALRPAETSEEWRSDTRLQALDLAAVREGMTLVEAADRHMEARAIAVAMREVLEQPLARVALVTPDRDLAQAVRHELRRWQVELDDSGGDPLARFGRARLLMRVIAHVAEGFSPQSLAALIADPALTFGLAPDEARAAAIRFEVTALRQDLPPQSPSAITTSFALAQTRLREDRHAPRLLRKKDEAFWALPQRFAHLLAGALMPLEAPASAPLQDHLAALVTCLDTLAPPAEHPSPEDAALEALLQGLAADAQHHPVGSLNDALPVLAWALAKETLRAPLDAGTRASVYGLAEARGQCRPDHSGGGLQ